MIKFRQYQDSFGENASGAIDFSDTVFIRNLSANTEEVINCPDSSRFAIFQYDTTKLWVSHGSDTLTIPTGSSDDKAIALNPDTRYISNDREIRMISDKDCQVVVSFYG